MRKYIFLDFDGVLHAGNPSSNPLSNNQKDCYLADALADKLTELSHLYKTDIKVVFSTSWQHYCSLNSLKNHVGEKLAHFAIGGTLLFDDGNVNEELNRKFNGDRLKEVDFYCQRHNIDFKDVIIIDDFIELFVNLRTFELILPYLFKHVRFTNLSKKTLADQIYQNRNQEDIFNIVENALICLNENLSESGLSSSRQLQQELRLKEILLDVPSFIHDLRYYSKVIVVEHSLGIMPKDLETIEDLFKEL